MSATEAELRAALRKMHARACGNEGAVYMSVPADPRRDADLLLDAAIDELVALRALLRRALPSVQFACSLGLVDEINVALGARDTGGEP